MPTVVQNTADLDEVSAQGVVDRERKPMNGSTPERAVDDATHSWHGGDQAEGVIEFRLELRPQTGTLCFIPRKSLRDIRRGFGSEFKPIRHDRLRSLSLARTSSHVSPGPDAGSSSRRSSSSLCQSGRSEERRVGKECRSRWLA